MTPFFFIGKEIERRGQEGEEISILENTGPTQYHVRRTLKTRGADPKLILRAQKFPLRRLMRESGASQHAIERFLRGERTHPKTQFRLKGALEKMERENAWIEHCCSREKR